MPVNYPAGEESLEFFWQAAISRYARIYHDKSDMTTEWSPADVLRDAAVSVTELRIRQYAGETRSITAWLGAEDRQDTCLMILTWFKENKRLQAQFAAGSEETLKFYADAVMARIPALPAPEPEEDDGILVHFTFSGAQGPQTYTREISAPEWKDIEGNYSLPVAGKLAELISADPGEITGKVAVLHGIPRTGKTTFLRSLARAWKDKAHFSYIVDAEQFFGDASYMMKVLLTQNHRRSGEWDSDGEEDSGELWNVLIFEDAEEFIAPGAKATVGQALSRLLNLGDGMLGQGLKVLFLFTTNATMDRLHAAVTGDGRCFFNEEIPALTRAEAGKWLQDRGSDYFPGSAKALGELYKILRDGIPEDTEYHSRAYL